MLSFMDLINKNGNNREDNLGHVFTRQGAEFNRYQQKIQKQVIEKEPSIFKKEEISSHDKNSKKRGSYYKTIEGFQTYPILNNDNQPIDKKALLSKEYIKQHVDLSKVETAKSNALLQTANTTLQDSKINNASQLEQNISEYEKYNNQLIQQTNDYLSNANAKKNVNVYVNSFYDEKYKPLTIYRGLYNTNTTTPAMELLDGSYNYATCNDMAYRLGNSYFGLTESTDASGIITSTCGLSNDTDYIQNGIYQEKCQKASDGNIYGLQSTNAVYQLLDPEKSAASSYVGCYQDNTTTPAMIPTGLESGSSPPIYQPVYSSGSYGDGPWGASTYSNGTAFPSNDTIEWIWNVANSQSTAPGYVPILFVGQYTSPSTSYQYVNIYGMCDNSCNILVNGSSTYYVDSVATTDASMSIVNGWGTNTNPIYTVQFQPGVNTIQVNAINQGEGPAGLFLTITDSDGNILTGTNSTGSNSTTWVYSTTVSQYYPPNSQSFNVEACAKYARTYGFNYFGLQNILNLDTSLYPETAQCFVSNSLSQTEEYGESIGFLKGEDNKRYGTQNSMSVYQMDKTGDASVMGLVGYINEKNELLQYPSSMLQPGTNYGILENYNSQNNTEIQTINATVNSTTGEYDMNSLITDCMTNCNSNTSCNGFVLDKTNYSCILNENMYSPSNITGNLNYDTDYTLYMRQPEIIGNEPSCPTRIISTNSLSWDNYTKSDNEMSSTTKCSLAELNGTLLKKRNEIGKNIDKNASKINNNINEFVELSQNMNNQLDIDNSMVNSNLSIYNQIYNQYKNAVKNGSTNLDNILTNSQISVLQSNSAYIIWVVLALLIIVLTIYIFRTLLPTNAVETSS